jgi:hypothetical protein
MGFETSRWPRKLADNVRDVVREQLMENERPAQLDLGLGLVWPPVQDQQGNATAIPDDVSRAQRLKFGLMLEATGNTFDGHRIVTDRIRNRRLWWGVVMDRDPVALPEQLGAGMSLGLHTLRDIGHGWNADTLYILSSGEDDTELLRIAASWHADEIH